MGIFFILISVVSFYRFFFLLKKIKPIKSAKKLIKALIYTILASLLSLLFISIQGYQALTNEIFIAKVSIIQKNEQNFIAIVQYENSDEHFYHLAGDEVMFEANIIKWKPWANIVGLNNIYRMDRIRGRYLSIDDEKNKPTTVYKLSDEKSIDIAQWRDNYQSLSFVLDVEHGSASYAPVDKKSIYSLVMTTNGLLLRELVD